MRLETLPPVKTPEVETYAVGNPQKNRRKINEGVLGIGEGNVGRFSSTGGTLVLENKSFTITRDILRGTHKIADWMKTHQHYTEPELSF